MAHRSYLFVPADRPERIAKALASGAHAVIVDLEDAVPAAAKDGARDALAKHLSEATPVLVRINGFGTPWHDEDLRACRHPGVAGIVLPKAENATQIDLVGGAFTRAMPVLPLVETAQGLWNAHAIAHGRGVVRLAFGAIDFCADVGIGGDREELDYARSQLVLVSKLAAIERPVDGVTTTFDDVAAIERDTVRARRFGFGAKLCIHPKQVAVVNACFAPTAGEIAWATRVVDAAAKAAGAAVALDGKMIDRPVILQAEEILREGRAAP
jgi:citrate lyase subunit beta/citryl-CoA lyase